MSRPPPLSTAYLSNVTRRFFGLFGLYYSLQYMSLSDATVLTFLAPTVTSALGFLFLKEAVSWKQAVAGRESILIYVSFSKREN